MRKTILITCFVILVSYASSLKAVVCLVALAERYTLSQLVQVVHEAGTEPDQADRDKILDFIEERTPELGWLAEVDREHFLQLQRLLLDWANSEGETVDERVRSILTVVAKARVAYQRSVDLDERKRIANAWSIYQSQYERIGRLGRDAWGFPDEPER